MSEESPHSPPHSPVSPEEDPLSVPAAVETRAEPAEATEETGPGVAEKEPEAQPAGAKDAPETEEKPVEKESALPEIPEGSPASDAPPPSPPAKEAPESSQVVDEALAQLVSMGYDAADASVAVAQVAGMFDGTAGVPVEALVDGAVAILSGQPAFASGGSPRRQINAPLAAPTTPAAGKPIKPILKTTTPDSDKSSFFSSARNWLTSHLPTSVSTIGNTFANTLKSPSAVFAPDWNEQREGEVTGAVAGPSTPAGPPVPPKHPRAGKRVRFSFHDISVAPPADFDEHEPTFGTQSTQPASPVEAGPSSPREGEMETEAQEPRAPELEPFVRRPPGEEHTASEIYRLYMSECDRRREKPIPRLIEDMQEAFAKEEVLAKIDLSGTVIDKRNVYPLAEILSVEFGLKQLSLEACGIDDDCLKILLNNLLNLDTLPWLNIAGNRKLSNNGLKFAAIYIKKSKSLKYLDISRTVLDRTACSYLTHALSTGPAPPDPASAAPGASLEVLKLEDCKLRAAQLEVLAPGIAFSNLHYLSLRRNALDVDAAAWAAEMIRPDDELRKLKWKRGRLAGRRKLGLGCLDLRENEIKHGVGAIAQALALNSALKRLIVRDNKIGPAGLDILAEVLKLNRGVEALDLGSNPLGAASPAMEKLKDALSVNKSLKELGLSSVGLSSEACVTIAESLSLCSLSRLDITFNPIDVAGLMAIAASLKANETVVGIEVVPVLKQHRDGGGHLVEEDPDFMRLMGDITAQCEKNAVKVKEAADARLKELEASGRTQEDIEKEEEEEEEREMIAEAQREEKERQRRQEERQKADARRAASDAPLEPRGFDAATIRQDFDTARESFSLLKEILDAGATEKEVLEQLYLQCLELEGRLLAAVNNNMVSSEKLLSEILALNDGMRPVLQSCEHLFAPKPVSDVKGKSPATQRPLPPVPAPTEVDETPLVRRRPTDKETDSKPSSSSAGAAGAEDEELASFLDEIDEAVGSAGVTPQGSTDHLVEDIESLLKDN